MFIEANPNPKGKHTGDCTVRAIALATDQSWDATFTGLAANAYELADMPSSNAAWGQYLKSKGFKRHALPDTCPDCYTVSQFAADHPIGTYVVACESHVVCVIDGDWLDTWDSGDEPALYFWTKEE